MQSPGPKLTRGFRAAWADLASEPYPVKIETIRPNGSSTAVSIFDLPLAYPYFQPTPDGGFIAVGGRAQHTKAGPEKNALILDADGALIGSFCVGDGVNDIQTTPSGQIWVSYHDEGVFGNYGWQRWTGSGSGSSAGTTVCSTA